MLAFIGGVVVAWLVFKLIIGLIAIYIEMTEIQNQINKSK
jgi:hypothetical protein